MLHCGVRTRKENSYAQAEFYQQIATELIDNKFIKARAWQFTRSEDNFNKNSGASGGVDTHLTSTKKNKSA